MSLYLKYRPKLIVELDLAGVRKTLNEMVSGNKLAHAYLFTGPRGAGKTSAARILARVINCEKNATKLGEPCNECPTCLSILNGSAVDVIEIDAASNRGIDDIRELKERIRLAPSQLRKKVYIIDEVHMLTTEAFNALLKTLEEPPNHAVFILCTTESHKVPATIVSRCVRVAFTKATNEEMRRSFARVIKGEKANVAPEAIELLSYSVDGSFRDGVKILDTVLALGRPIVKGDVETVLYGAAGWDSLALSKALIERDTSKALQLFRSAIDDGTDLTHVVTSVMRDIRSALLAHYGIVESTISIADMGVTKLVTMLDDAVRKVGSSTVPAYLIEMVILEWCGSSVDQSISGSGNQKVRKSVDQTVNKIAVNKTELSTSRSTEKHTHRSPNVAVANVSAPIGGVDATEAWQKLITTLNGDSYSLGALLSKARPGTISGNTLTILVAHEFHREQIMNEKFRSRLEIKLSEVLGAPILIHCELAALQTSPQVATIAQVAPEDNELMDAAEEIFSATS